jgi:hypothetical protein
MLLASSPAGFILILLECRYPRDQARFGGNFQPALYVLGCRKHEGGDGVKPDPDTGRSETGRGPAVEQLLAARGPHLMQAAIALAGSRPDGEDLLQAALERLLRNYRRVESDAEGYLRRTLYNLAADGWRR